MFFESIFFESMLLETISVESASFATALLRESSAIENIENAEKFNNEISNRKKRRITGMCLPQN